ncbi:hypothetical protein TpMuguga_01g00647 [Theileria parva strain Muguga]|uniref:Uncharacterized protein n=1 Tax=Theileria parva TaxID=5875 RepID=Q4N823_THEPA|nr:uncharacterized protein TpMuguga_01g00647 [Theileria parva strain Muguga]EAN33885.1 hypothetical protein TpMuguga_01g00647 [Theileria parva strain Muguga]|eukprot:XP_766168.1 hypothetical protein [Theileria parva strain Muguga]
MFGGKSFWKYTCGPYPTSLYFKSSGPGPLLYLNFDPYYYLYVYDGTKWVLREELSHRSSVKLEPSLYPENITIFTEKIEGESVKVVENDTCLYRVYDHGNGIFLYVFDLDARCVEVKYRGHTVTKRQSRGPYPRRIVFDSRTLTFEFEFQNKSTIYRVYDSGWYISDVSDKLEHIEYEIPNWILQHSYYKFGSKLYLSNFRMLTSDNKYGSDAKPVSVHNFILSCNKWVFGYFYPVPINIPYLELTYKGHIVFKSTEYPYRGNPRIVLFNIDDNKICVFFDSKFKLSFNYIDVSDKKTVVETERKPEIPETSQILKTVSEPVSEPKTESVVTKEVSDKTVAKPLPKPAKTDTKVDRPPETKPEPKPVPIEVSKPEIKPDIVVTESVSKPVDKSVVTSESPRVKEQTKPPEKPAVSKEVPIPSSDQVIKPSEIVHITAKEPAKPPEPAKPTPAITVEAKPTTARETKPVTLDINKTKSTEQIEYSKSSDKKFHIYAPKDGNSFNKITEKNTVIWEPKDEVYGSLVRIKVEGKEKHLAILLQNRNLVLFHKTNKQPWTDITKDRYDVTALKFYRDADTELTSADYKVSIVSEYSYRFKFNSGVKCKKIKYGDDDVWKSTDDTEYSDAIMLDIGLISNNFFVYKNENDFKKLDYGGPITPRVTEVTTPVKAEPESPLIKEASEPVKESSEPIIGKEVSKPETEPSRTRPVKAPVSAPSIKPVIVDIDVLDSTHHFNYSEIDMCCIYVPKTGRLFCKVIQGKTGIWEAKDNVYCTFVRTKTEGNEKYLSILLDNNTFKLFQHLSGKWTDITNKRHDVTKLKFLGHGDVDLKSTNYNVTIVDYSYRIKFSDEANCRKIKYGEDYLWKHSDDSEFESFKMFDLCLISNEFFILKSEYQFKKLEFKPSSPSTATLVKPTPVTFAVSEPETRPAPGASKEVDEQPSFTLLSLDIGQREDGKGFYFSRKDKNGTFVSKFGYGFNVVMHNKTEIWKTDDTKNYSTKIVIDGLGTCGTTKNIDIFLLNGEMKQFNRPSKNKPWEEKSKIISVDLKKIENTTEYGFSTEDIYTTIFTKHSYSLNKLVKGNKVVWEDQSGCGTNKVVFVQSVNKEKYLAIILTNSNIVLLHKSGKNKPWENITNTRNSLSYIKAFKDDGTKLDSSQYKIELNKFSYGFKFNYIMKCHKILYKDEVVYKYDGDREFEFLKGIYLYLSSNRFYVLNMENESKLLDKESDLITLDVKKRQSTVEYVFLEKTNFPTFVYRDSYLFNKIVHDKTPVWESGGDNDYSYKVVLDNTSGSSNCKNITVHLVSGHVKYFYYSKDSNKTDKWLEKYKTFVLNVDETSGKTEFDYSVDGNKRIFSAKPGFVFYKIIDSKITFWNSRSHFDFANKVVLYETDSNKIFFLLFHEDNTLTHLYKKDKWYSRIGVVLDISISRDESSFYYGEDYESKVEFYHPKEKRVFIKVVKYNEIIWETENPEEYAIKVLTDGTGRSSKNRVTIHMSNGEIKHFYKDGDKPWSKACGKIALDIEKKRGSIEVDYVDGFFKIYTPKAGYKFIRVVKGKKPDIVFWEAKSDEYATEVRIIPFESSEYVLIFVYESKFVLFHKGGDHKDWTDITDTRCRLSDLKFYKHVNRSEYSEIGSSLYKITNKNTSYVYSFKCNVECDLIQYKDKTLYKFNPDLGYPSKIHFDIYRNSFYAFYSGDMCHRLYLGEEINAISLSINVKDSTDQFDYVQTEEIERYIPKVGYMFNSLTEHRTGYFYTDCCKFDCCEGDCCDSDCCDCDCCEPGCCGSGCCGCECDCFESGLCGYKCCYCTCCDFDCCGSACCASGCFSFGCRRSVDQVIWETKEPLEYATKVIIDCSEEDEQTLTIIMCDGFKQVFTRSDKNEAWEAAPENKRCIEHTNVSQ